MGRTQRKRTPSTKAKQAAESQNGHKASKRKPDSEEKEEELDLTSSKKTKSTETTTTSPNPDLPLIARRCVRMVSFL